MNQELNKSHNADCLEFTKSLDSGSIDCAITSPPYYQLRDYGWTGQWGLEKTYQEYLDHLIELMAELKRVLKPTGTMWINLGDSYGTFRGKSGGGADSFERKQTGEDRFNTKKQIVDRLDKNNDLEKSLLLIPHRFAIRCIDELNLKLRNDIIWAKPNGMPESVTDRFSKKHEFFFFFVKQQKYYFDLGSVKDKTITKDKSLRDRDNTKLNNTPGRTRMAGLKENSYDSRNPGDVADFWDIPTQPSSEKHYATFNYKLIDKPILAGCPEDGVLFDPFAGTGTTLVRGLQLNRKVIGCDGKPEYCEIANRRITEFQSQGVLAL